MYVPPHFDETRTDVLHDLIESNLLGTLVTYGPNGLDANQIPFVLDRAHGEKGTLHCHVARNNPVWQELAVDGQVLVVFRAADAYISPHWYPSKKDHHRQVPTWNFLVVNVHGKAIVQDNEAYVRRMLAKLTRKHEETQPVPWKMGDAPQDYIDSMVKSIVGIEIEISRLAGKVKLSQNRELRDVQNAGEMLVGQGDHMLGEAMLAVARKMK